MDTRHLSVVGSEGGANGPALPGSGTVDEWISEARLLKVAGDALARKTDAWKYSVGDWWNKCAWGTSARKLGAKELGIPYGTCSSYAQAAKQVTDSDRSEIGQVSAQVIASVPAGHRERYTALAKAGANTKELKKQKMEDFGASRRGGTRTRAKTDASARKEKRKAEIAETAKVRAAIRENAYNTMKNAPPGAQNNPMFWRAAKVEALINELRNRSPHDAASSLLGHAPSYFTRESLAWWTEFVTACIERTEREGLKRVKRDPAQAQWAETGLDARDK